MNYYDNPDLIEEYFELAEGFDGRPLVEAFRTFVPAGSSVLELGMGPGYDLDLLRESYRAVGSDLSPLFLERYRKNHLDAELLELDARHPRPGATFDGIYGNKVLIHLDDGALAAALERQTEILEVGGILFHTFWRGDDVETYEDLVFHYRREEEVGGLLPENLELLETRRYAAVGREDSFFIAARRKG